MFEDVIGQQVNVGDICGVAFSWSHASVGYIRIGTVESLEPDFKMRWQDGKVSPKMVYNSVRMILLTDPHLSARL
jgi:hypothetical protein